MQQPQKRDQEIHIYLTIAEKNILCRQAILEQKSVSKYLLDIGLSSSGKGTKNEGVQSLATDVLELKKQLYVIARLLLLIGTSEIIGEEEIIEFFKRTNQKADELFDREA